MPSATETIDYHRQELAIALDASHACHIAPPLLSHHRTILDVGCGMGQTLIAANLGDEVMAYGVDPDHWAIEQGKAIVPANIRLSVSKGEKLQFDDNFFDLVICRVALPYMNVAPALREMRRVLKPKASVWLVLHPIEMFMTRAVRSFRQGNLRDVLYCCFVVANGTLFNLTGRQIALKGRTETFQNKQGIRRALEQSGFEEIVVEQDRFLVATARTRSN